MSVCVIFNPTARGEKAQQFRGLLEQMARNWILKPTTGPGTARKLASDAVEEGHETIVAAGGDGTLNEVLNGIMDAPDGPARSRLGVLPLGTINVFARELKIPLEIRKMTTILEQCNEICLDVGCADFQRNGQPERRHFIQLAGAGYDARSVELVDWELKKKLGTGAYVAACARALGETHPLITIETDSETYTGELVVFGNGKLYGGNYPVFHKGDLQDGVLDAVVFNNVNWAGLPSHLWNLISGRLFKPGGSLYLQSRNFTLTSSSPVALQLEGELVGHLPARITVLPRALRVLAP